PSAGVRGRAVSPGAYRVAASRWAGLAFLLARARRSTPPPRRTQGVLDMCRLEGKIALITGGASGIGLATAREFHAAGAKLAIADVSDASAVARELGAIAIRVDVTDTDQVEAMVAKTVSHYGRIDVLFNNAGIERHSPLAAMDLAEHRRVI